MLDWLHFIAERSPNVALVIALLIGVYLLARYLRTSEMKDMRERLDYLDQQVRALRYRDRCYFEFVLYDEGYHHRAELHAASGQVFTEKHIPFLQFRDAWMAERGLTDEQDDIWR